ncbi:hypothetical protein B4599_05875 [Xanthomonas oryzae pv. oryzae]|nr:hypothetical protein B4599_05875 [Xanthomonas oryzae pv. oryzae]
MVGPSLHRDQIMAMNRVQFQAGLSLPAFLKRYGNAKQCEQALEISRWPQGFVCPRCAASAHSRFQRHGTTYWQCTACYRQTSLRSGTVMDNSKLPLRTWLLGMSTSCCPTIHDEERRTFGIAGGAGRNAPDGVATDGRRRIAGRSGRVVRIASRLGLQSAGASTGGRRWRIDDA